MKIGFCLLFIIGLSNIIWAAELEYEKSYLWNDIWRIALNGDYLYCGLDDGLQILDISDSKNIHIAAQCLINRTNSNSPSDCEFALFGDYLFMAWGKAGLTIFDISMPTRPVAIYEYPDTVNEIAIYNNYAYFAKQQAGVRICDISDPSHLRSLNFIPINDYISDISIHEDYAYLTIESSHAEVGHWFQRSGELKIIDVHDPANPQTLSSFHESDSPGKIIINGDYAFLSLMDAGFQIVNISDPAIPKLISEQKFTTGGVYSSLAISGYYLYVSPTFGKNRIYDISSPQNPVLINNDTTDYSWRDMLIKDNLAIIRSEDLPRRFYKDDMPAVQILDIGNPKNISVIGEFGRESFIKTIRVDGSFIYVLDNDRGLQILDMSKPLGQELISELNLGEDLETMAIHNGFAYIGDLNDTMYVVDVKNPHSPKEILNYDMGHPISALDSFSHYLLVDSYEGQYIYGADNPPNLALKSYFSESSNGHKILPDNKYIYLTREGFQIYDIKNIEKPILLGSHATKIPLSIDVAGDYAYIVEDKDGLEIFDISNPGNINTISSLKSPDIPKEKYHGQFWQIYIKDDYAYLLRTGDEYVIYVANISNPKSPIWVDKSGGIDYVEDFLLVDDIIYVATMNEILTFKINK